MTPMLNNSSTMLTQVALSSSTKLQEKLQYNGPQVFIVKSEMTEESYQCSFGRNLRV